MPRYWLIKSEPETYSIDDLARDRRTGWEGVRNYQARNHLRAMSPGDLALFYHSNAEPSGVAGIARVSRGASSDLTALDPSSKYHDPGATDADPRWSTVEVEFVEKLSRVVSLGELKADPATAEMEVARKGSRLSVTPVSPEHFAQVRRMAAEEAPAAVAAASSPSPGSRPRPRSSRALQSSKTPRPAAKSAPASPRASKTTQAAPRKAKPSGSAPRARQPPKRRGAR